VRKLCSISLIVLLVAPAVIQLGLLHWQKHEWKRAIKFEWLSKAENAHLLTVFELTENQLKELNWCEPHEFKLKGAKYDVIDQCQNGDLITLRCFHDKKEEALEKRIEQAVANALGSTSKSDKAKTEPDTSFKIYTLQNTFSGNSIRLSEQGQHFSTNQYSGYKDPVMKVLSPPPKWSQHFQYNTVI